LAKEREIGDSAERARGKPKAGGEGGGSGPRESEMGDLGEKGEIQPKVDEDKSSYPQKGKIGDRVEKAEMGPKVGEDGALGQMVDIQPMVHENKGGSLQGGGIGGSAERAETKPTVDKCGDQQQGEMPTREEETQGSVGPVGSPHTKTEQDAANDESKRLEKMEEAGQKPE
jgi:hypothetical protein